LTQDAQELALFDGTIMQGCALVIKPEFEYFHLPARRRRWPASPE
jgi:hypothetical protein